MSLQSIDDDLLNEAIAHLDSGKPTTVTPTQAAALRAEYARRRQPDNVAQDLDAAATPIEPDAEVMDPRAAYQAAQVEDGWTPDEAAQLAEMESKRPHAFNERLWATPEAREASRAGAQRHRALNARMDRFDQSLADAYGHNAAPVDVTGPDTVTVDGLQVRAHTLSDGKPFGGMYTLGALREAKEQADEARRVANVREMVAREKERFDWTSDDPTADQIANRQALRDAERATYDARQKARAYQIEHANDPKTPYEQKVAARRERVAQMAQLAGGSQNINTGNRAFFNALAMLDGVNPDRMDAQQRAMTQMMPMDPNRAAVEAANNAQLTQLGLRVAQGQGFQQPLPEQRAAAQQQLEMQMAPEERAALYRDKPEVHPAEVTMADAHVAERYSAPGSVWGLGGLSSGFSSDEQQQTIDWLVNEKGYSPAKAQKIVDNIASKRRGQSWHTLW